MHLGRMFLYSQDPWWTPFCFSLASEPYKVRAQFSASAPVSCSARIPRSWHNGTTGAPSSCLSPVKIPVPIWLSKASLWEGSEHDYWTGSHKEWPYSPLILSSWSIFQGHVKSKLQIPTLLPASTTWAPVTPVHEYLSQEDLGDLRSVFPSPSCSFFSFFLWQLLFKLARLGHLTPLLYCAWFNSVFPRAACSFCELNRKHEPVAPSAIPPGISFSQTKQIPAIPGHRLKHKKSEGNWRNRVGQWKHTALDCTFFSGNLGVVLHSWNGFFSPQVLFLDSLERMQLI